MALARETKVGLVVAVSFLSLVGVVVAARMRTSSDENKNPVAIGKPKPNTGTQANDSDKPADAAAPAPPGTAVAMNNTGSNTGNVGNSQSPGLVPTPSVWGNTNPSTGNPFLPSSNTLG